MGKEGIERIILLLILIIILVCVVYVLGTALEAGQQRYESMTLLMPLIF